MKSVWERGTYWHLFNRDRIKIEGVMGKISVRSYGTEMLCSSQLRCQPRTAWSD
jgi:hypothetical protein